MYICIYITIAGFFHKSVFICLICAKNIQHMKVVYNICLGSCVCAKNIKHMKVVYNICLGSCICAKNIKHMKVVYVQRIFP